MLKRSGFWALLFGFVFLVSVGYGDTQTPSTVKQPKSTDSLWPVAVGYIGSSAHRSNSFSWWYIKEKDLQKEGWDKRVICTVDDSQNKWMRLNNQDVKLKMLRTTNPDNILTKGTKFSETYSAGPYRIEMNYLQTNDPKSEDHEFIAYDVVFTISRNKQKVAFMTKCTISE